jgi:hypothetical protein
MNKVTDEQPRIYAFVYELGKMSYGARIEFVKDVKSFLEDFLVKLKTEELINKYPEFKLGEEAHQAKEKVEDLKPKKKVKKEKK